MKYNKICKYRGVLFFCTLAVNLNLSRMHLMVSGIFNQFPIKQIFSLDSKAIQWLGNSLDKTAWRYFTTYNFWYQISVIDWNILARTSIQVIKWGDGKTSEFAKDFSGQWSVHGCSCCIVLHLVSSEKQNSWRNLGIQKFMRKSNTGNCDLPCNRTTRFAIYGRIETVQSTLFTLRVIEEQ